MELIPVSISLFYFFFLSKCISFKLHAPVTRPHLPLGANITKTQERFVSLLTVEAPGPLKYIEYWGISGLMQTEKL